MNNNYLELQALWDIQAGVEQQNRQHAQMMAEYYRANGITPPPPPARPKLGLVAQIARFTLFAFLILTALVIFLPVILRVGG
jgi:hypothetical protein